jgi:hypothetical protein
MMVKILNADKLEVIPGVRIVLIDETLNWCKEIQKRAGRLFGVYLFDQRRHVRCCEMTPSHECHFLKTIFTAEIPDSLQGERDDLQEAILEGNRETPAVSYFHVQDIDHSPSIESSRWSAKHYREIRDDYDDPEELHQAVMEAMPQAEHENESDYYSLISKMDARKGLKP